MTAVLGVVVLLGAAPARAGDEFERGFQNELGRIAAHRAVAGGPPLLADIFFGYPGYDYYVPVPVEPTVYYEHHYYDYYDHGHHDHHHHHDHHRHRYHDDCDD